MSKLGTLLCLVVSSLAVAEAPEPTTIGSWWRPSLYVEKIKKIEVINKTIKKVPIGSAGGDYLQFADLSFTVDVLPLSCNVTFLKGAIVGKYEHRGELTRGLLIGDLSVHERPDVASSCPGVPSRELKFLMPLVNGYGKNTTSDTTYVFQLPAKSKTLAAGVQEVKVRVHQLDRKVELVEPKGVPFLNP